MNIVLPALLQSVALLVIPIIAGIWYALRRRAPLVRPGCRHCGAPRSFQALALAEACDGCHRSGDELGEPIALGRRSWKAAILPPAFLVAAGLGVFVAGEVLRASQAFRGRPRPTLATIYTDFMSSRRDLMSDGASLLARERDGEDVIGAAQAALTAAIGSGSFEVDGDGAPIGIPSIATASGSGPIDLAAIVLLGLPGSTAPPPKPDRDLAARVLHACFLPYRLDGVAFRADRLIRIYSGGFEPVQSPLRRVFRVIACRVDGEPVELVDPHMPASAPGASAPLLLASDHLLRLADPALASTSSATNDNARRVELECEEFLFRRFDAERLRDLRGRVIPLERWPTPLATRRVTITLDRVP